MIEVKKLHYSFGKKSILKGLNFNLEEGGFYGLMGANGSGKTTLLRCLSGMLPIERNHIFIHHTDITTLSAKKLARLISVVPQRQSIEFEFSAQEIVAMGRNPYQRRLQSESEEDALIVEDCMKKTNTWHFRNSSIDILSGGEFQRVIIARAMAQQTPVLLLDEPLSNLDIAHQYEILDLLTSLQKEKKITIVLILHDLNMALKYCNKLLLLTEGEIAFLGKTDLGLTNEIIASVFGVQVSFLDVENTKHILFSKKNR